MSLIAYAAGIITGFILADTILKKLEGKKEE